jgi:translation initiation factor 3 subunit D
VSKGQYPSQGGYQRGSGRGGRGGASRGGAGAGRSGAQRPWQNRNQNDVTGFVHNLGKKGFREPSIEVRGDWPVIIELSKNQLEKLNSVNPTFISTAAQCGSIHQYNFDLDKSGCHKQLPVTDFQGKVYANVPTLEDPVIRRLAQENKADIFATEIAASAIMTAPKSLYSWDVVIKKHGDKIFIDKRDETNMLDYLTVNETSHENQPVDDEGVNGVRQIMDEAVKVHNNFLYQQYVKTEDKSHSLAEKDPFMADEHEVCVRQGYLYKIWRLDNKRRICIRSTVHSYKSKIQGEKEDDTKLVYQNTYTLLEFENGKANWKGNLDLMMAQCLTKEVQDNSSKVSRWVVQSLLAGVEHIKFAFVSRRNLKDPSKHVILGTYGIDTKSF